MDSREFEIMVDVIADVGMAQPPAMENVNAEAELLLEVEGDEVSGLCGSCLLLKLGCREGSGSCEIKAYAINKGLIMGHR